MDRSDAARLRGQAGERIARAFLETRGYTVHGANLRRGRYEVDLLARRGETWVVLEVKWRTADPERRGPAEAWSPAQRRRAHAAAAWLREERDPAGLCPWRLDLITLEEHPGGLVLRHHRAAWSPGDSPW